MPPKSSRRVDTDPPVSTPDSPTSNPESEDVETEPTEEDNPEPEMNPEIPEVNPEEKYGSLDEPLFITQNVEINMTEFSDLFNKLVSDVSDKYKIDFREITPYGTKEGYAKTPTITYLVGNGTAFFDAVIFKTGKNSEKIKFKASKNKNQKMIDAMTYKNISEALFFAFFLLLVRGRYPADGMTEEKKDVPKFLKGTLALSHSAVHYRNILASFTLEKLNPEWIRLIKIKNLGLETRQRLGLQVAGYRWLKVFSIIPITKQLSAEKLNAVKSIQDFVDKGAVWEMYSLTRSTKVASRFISLNKLLTNLVIACYTPEEIAKMKAASIIPIVPVFQYGYENYSALKKANFADFNSEIFPKENG
jgi:hypothetical protein